MTTPRAHNHVVLAQSAAVDHFTGLEPLLRARGLLCDRFTPDCPPPRFSADTKVVCVADLFSFTALRALREARRVGAASLLMMDGIVEWRNTFCNPRLGNNFLRPAPVDLIACAGLIDCRILTALGNNAVATGLPRLGPRLTRTRHADGPCRLLIATARNPAFSPFERAALLAALRSLHTALVGDPRFLPIWRLTDGLDLDLGVRSDTRPLQQTLADCDAALLTPSTLAIETMRAGLRTAILYTQPLPRWQQPPVIWESWRTPSPADLLDRLADGASFPMPRQEAFLAQLHREDAQPELLLADLIESLCEAPLIGRGRNHPLPPSAILPQVRPADPARPRVLLTVHCEGSPVGGVTTWALRMAREFARRPELGFDLHVLFLGDNAAACDIAPFLDDVLRPLVHTCIIDPTLDHIEILTLARQAIERLDPHILLPNYADLCYAAAMHLQTRGVRCIAVAHTHESYYQHLLATFDRWDAAVGVSRACMEWIEPLARRHGEATPPVEQITYGVEVADAPRPVDPDPEAPLRLAYVGRMVQWQKRLFDLLPLIDGLESRCVSYELHLVGDGPDLDAWKSRLNERTLRFGRVLIHGRRDPAWVAAFWPTVDAAILVSEFEGTSITMLEAMAHGVVPVVTAVESGVSEWVTDGETGIVVPVAAPHTMAQRLADLAADRTRLANLGRAAWNLAAQRISLEHMADCYTNLFRTVLARPAHTAPTDLGLRLTDAWRWRKDWADDPDRARALIEDTLRDAGYTRIGRNCPAPGDDAVIVEESAEPPDAEDIRAWRARGLGVAFAPALLETPEPSTTYRMRCVIERALADGAQRIALYGTGKHTQRAAGLFSLDLPIVGFIDDRPPKSGRAFSLPVTTPDRALADLDIDALILSSDAWERELWAKTADLRVKGVKVYAVYGSDRLQSPRSPALQAASTPSESDALGQTHLPAKEAA